MLCRQQNKDKRQIKICFRKFNSEVSQICNQKVLSSIPGQRAKMNNKLLNKNKLMINIC